jgi:REP element-mobilizing transposase RayT
MSKRFQPFQPLPALTISNQMTTNMAHSKVKIWIHAIWRTKHSEVLIQPEKEREIYSLIRKEFEETGCIVDAVNGMPDHVHVLFLLNPERSIRSVIKQVKGAVSHSINREKITASRFAWGVGYAAFSVSVSNKEKVRKYIDNQKIHHRKMNFQKEIEEFLKLHGLNR